MSAVGRAVGPAMGPAMGNACSQPWMHRLRRRQVWTGDGVGASGAIPAWTASGDFEIEVDFATSGAAEQMLSGSTSNDHLIYVSVTTGKLVFKGGDSASNPFWLTLSDTSYADGALHTVKMQRVGDDFTITCGAESKTVTKVAAEAITLDYIGRTAWGSFFNGPITRVKLTDTAGGDNRTYALNSGSTLYEMPVGGSLGAELVTNGTFDTDLSGWGGNWNYTAGTATSGTIAMTQTGLGIVSGDRYLLELDVVTSPGEFALGGGSGFAERNTALISGTGHVTKILTCDTTGGALYLYPTAGAGIEIDNVSIRKLPANTLIYTGTSAAHWEQYKRTYNPDTWTALDGDPVLEIA